MSTVTQDKCWKQPIATNLHQIFGDDNTTRLVWIELLLRARNKNNEDPEKFGGTLHFLKRGQCVCGREELAKRVNSNGKAVWKSLSENLQKRYNWLDICPTRKGTIVTIKNYDEVIKMENKWENRGTTEGQLRDSNKSVKSGESEKKYTEYLQTYNSALNTRYTSTTAIERNLDLWLNEYTLEEILSAVRKIPKHDYWHDKMKPETLLRRKTTQGEPVNYIEDLLNYEVKLTEADMIKNSLNDL